MILVHHFVKEIVDIQFGTAIDDGLYLRQQLVEIDSLGIGNVIKSNLELTDLRRRQLILDYVEQFRTAYNQKDIKFLNQVFSDDALIITGKVVQRRQTGDHLSLSHKVEYTRQTKQEYIRNLKMAFARNKWIDVKFDIPTKGQGGPCNWIDRTTKRDSNGQLMNFYGVRLIQHWKSSNYSDDGYLFLLWEFPKGGGDPIIHVRTWQPMEVDGVHQEPDDNISTVGAFEDAFVL